MAARKNAALPPVLVLHNLPFDRSTWFDKYPESEGGIMDEVNGVTGALTTMGIPWRVVGLKRFTELPAILAASREPIVFNLVESLMGDLDDVNLVPAVCRAFGKGHTGNSTPALLLGLNKWRTKAVLRMAGIPTAWATLVPIGGSTRGVDFPKGRLIVKPAATDASEGIDYDSLFDGPGPRLTRGVRKIHEIFHQSAIIEKFIDGREINVSVLEDGDGTRVMPLAEIDFSAFPPDRPRMINYGAKWLPDTFEYKNTNRLIPSPLPARVAARIRATALAAWRVCGLGGYARVDFRLAADWTPYVLEVNPNPDIDPDAGFGAAIQAGFAQYPEDRRYAEFVRLAVTSALPPSSRARAKK
jgi:D-alanine-D-alanine ligase